MPWRSGHTRRTARRIRQLAQGKRQRVERRKQLISTLAPRLLLQIRIEHGKVYLDACRPFHVRKKFVRIAR